MKKLLIATHNPAKFAEIKDLLFQLLGREDAFSILSLSDLGIKEKVVEDGETYEENAVKKAKFYFEKTNLLTLGDDGGIEIDHLGGAPGVYSHRWLNKKGESSDEEIIKHTLSALKDVPFKKRGAKLRAVIALAVSSEKVYLAEGEIRGIIAKERYRGRQMRGFPFRSLFYLPEIGKYYNPYDMNKEEEERFNHRRRALKKIVPILKRLIYA